MMPVFQVGSDSALKARIEELESLLSRWVNIADNGKYGHHSKHPLAIHPIVEETRTALQPKGGS
jgi:hypothetical protein